MSEEITSSQEFFKKLEPLEKNLKDTKNIRMAFGTKGSKIIQVAYNIMKKQLGALAEDEEVMISKQDRKTVKDASKLIYIIAIEKPITKFFKEVTREYLLLLFNWNKQLGRSRKINRYVTGTRRMLDATITMNQTISILQHLLKKLKNETRYRPPAFENAKHYLLSLQEDIEKTCPQ